MTIKRNQCLASTKWQEMGYVSRGGRLMINSLKSLFTGLLVAVSTTAFSAIYFVSPVGSDINSGLTGQPWKTIQKAADSMVAGDTVLVAAGIYPERVKTSSSGTLAAPITFQAVGTVTNYGFYVNHSGISINGFEIIGNTNTPDWEGAIEVYRMLNSISICNNYIHDFDPINTHIYGIHFYYSTNAATATANCIVSNNTIRNTSYVMLSINCSNALFCNNVLNFANTHDAIQCWGAYVNISGNLFTNISANPLVPDHTDIIQTFGDDPSEAYNILFERNYIVNCVSQLCQLEQKGRNIRDWTFRNNLWVNVGMGGNCDLENCNWYNNTFYRCTTNTAGPILLNCNIKGCASNSRVFNNAFVECGSLPSSGDMGWYFPENTNFTFYSDYNFVCSTGGAGKASFIEMHGINGGDPGFVDPTNYDFRLRPGSLLIDKGTIISGVTNDLIAVIRPQGTKWDIGAYEYPSGRISRPAPPTNLRILQ